MSDKQLHKSNVQRYRAVKAVDYANWLRKSVPVNDEMSAAWFEAYQRIFKQRELHFHLLCFLSPDIAWRISARKPCRPVRGVIHTREGVGDVIDMRGIYMPASLFSENEIGTGGLILDTFTQHIFQLDITEMDKNRNVLDFFPEGPYECAGVRIEPGDTVIDAGAYVADFSLLAAHKGAEAYAFEPSPPLLNGDLQRMLEANPTLRDRVHVIPSGLSDHDGFTEFQTAGGSSKIAVDEGAEGSTRVRLESLDAFAEREGLQRIDFIKADIEGAERLMLRGAERILRDWGPKLAICTYHLPDDPIVLEQIIREANPNYQVFHRYQKLFAWIPK